MFGLRNQRRNELGAGQLETVLLGVGAELLVADDFGVGAHLRFRPQLEAAEEPLLHGVGRFDGDSLLQGFGGQKKHPLTVAERRSNDRVENSRRLTASGRCPHQ